MNTKVYTAARYYACSNYFILCNIVAATKHTFKYFQREQIMSYVLINGFFENNSIILAMNLIRMYRVGRYTYTVQLTYFNPIELWKNNRILFSKQFVLINIDLKTDKHNTIYCCLTNSMIFMCACILKPLQKLCKVNNRIKYRIMKL